MRVGGGEEEEGKRGGRLEILKKKGAETMNDRVKGDNLNPVFFWQMWRKTRWLSGAVERYTMDQTMPETK